MPHPCQLPHRLPAMTWLADRLGACAAGALALWDLAHSASAVPVQLVRDQADFAVGCGLLHLNGGPGAPAFAWVNPRHVDHFPQPLSGWLGAMRAICLRTRYQPAPASRVMCGTPPVGLPVSGRWAASTPSCAGSPMAAWRRSATSRWPLTRLFIRLVDTAASHGVEWVVTPRRSRRRGSQVPVPGRRGLRHRAGPDRPRGGRRSPRRRAGPRHPDILRFGGDTVTRFRGRGMRWSTCARCSAMASGLNKTHAAKR